VNHLLLVSLRRLYSKARTSMSSYAETSSIQARFANVSIHWSISH